MTKEEKIMSVITEVVNAIVTKVEMPDALKAFNTQNNTLRVRVVYTTQVIGSDDPNSAMSTLLATVGNNSASVIANLDGYRPDLQPQQKVAQFVADVKGKTLQATNYSVAVSKLLDGVPNFEAVSQVHDATKKRSYSSLTDALLGARTDDSVKLSVFERLQTRLVTRLVDKRLRVGPYVPPTNVAGTNAGTAVAGNNPLDGVNFTPDIL